MFSEEIGLYMHYNINKNNFHLLHFNLLKYKYKRRKNIINSRYS